MIFNLTYGTPDGWTHEEVRILVIKFIELGLTPSEDLGWINRHLRNQPEGRIFYSKMQTLDSPQFYPQYIEYENIVECDNIEDFVARVSCYYVIHESAYK